jgi:hypothetical protein
MECSKEVFDEALGAAFAAGVHEARHHGNFATVDKPAKGLYAVDMNSAEGPYDAIAVGSRVFFLIGAGRNIYDRGIPGVRTADIVAVDMAAGGEIEAPNGGFPRVSRCALRWAWRGDRHFQTATPESASPEIRVYTDDDEPVTVHDDRLAALFAEALAAFAHTVKEAHDGSGQEG